ncbi:Histone lysine demethylase PHF8 [Frankliniella fusca]|uniref:Histone lysine demethylase PHF8 n=1 Tax=Frankliniella fusca TaxID=407009 RepID=A0AAE1LJ32_9NEOP|nr:Histone lysine demethylase PHF8 [Frankliniella fusca]
MNSNEVLIDLTATSDDSSDQNSHTDFEQYIKKETSTEHLDLSEEIITRCKVCYMAHPKANHRCCAKCKQQIVTDCHECICIVCQRAITKRAEQCFRCTRPVHNKCSSLQPETSKGIVVLMCDNCKTSRDTGLSRSALDDLKRGDSLTDEHLNAACKMLKAAFRDLAGLTAPENIIRLENQISVSPHIAEAHEDYMQMLNTGTGHWVLLVVCKGQPFLLDSSFHNKMTVHIKNQIREIMSSDKNFNVLIPNIQQQDNGTDCGLYVIANAVEFAKNRQVRKVNFIREKLRPHWLQCITDGKISQFPSEGFEHETVFTDYVIQVTSTKDTDILNDCCQNCQLKDPQPGHTCCKYCKVQNKRRGHVCECVVCLNPTSDNANLIPLLCKVCVKPVHEFCSKFVVEQASHYCYFCMIKKNVNLEKEVVGQVVWERGPISKDHIITATAFLRKQFPDLGGLAEPNDVVRKKEYLLFCYDNLQDGQDYIQFLSTGTGHWVLLVVQEGKLYLLGSNVKSNLTSELETQVAAIVNSFQSEFTIFLPVINNENDSGLVAIAYAIEFASTRKICEVSFNSLNLHWVNCLLEGKISVFPNSGKVSVQLEETITKVYCLCRLPEHYSTTMIDCDMCGEWYHPKCVDISNSNKWICALCKPEVSS